MANGRGNVKITLNLDEATMWSDRVHAESLAEQFGGVLMGALIEKV